MATTRGRGRPPNPTPMTNTTARLPVWQLDCLRWLAAARSNPDQTVGISDLLFAPGIKRAVAEALEERGITEAEARALSSNTTPDTRR